MIRPRGGGAPILRADAMQGGEPVSKQSKSDDGGGEIEGKDAFGDVTEAAAAVERELRRFELMAAAARRMSIDTRKGIERAARATTEAAGEHTRVNAALNGLILSIQAARERHEVNARALEARGQEIRRRAEEIGPLYDRFGALGEEGRTVGELVVEVAAKQRAATTPEDVRGLVVAIEVIEQRMGKLVDDARELGKEAAEVSATDLAAQCDTLRQQLGAAKNKLGLLRKGMMH